MTTIFEDEEGRLEDLGVEELSRRLFIAAGKGDTQWVEALLRAGASGRRANGKGQTALMAATKRGQIACVEALLPISDPQKKDEDGIDALLIAIVFGRDDIIRMLLPVSNPAACDRGGMNALMYFSLRKKRCDPVIYAEVFGRCDPNGVMNDGQTALDLAIKNGLDDCVSFFVEQPGVDLLRVGPDGETPFALALRMANLDCGNTPESGFNVRSARAIDRCRTRCADILSFTANREQLRGMVEQARRRGELTRIPLARARFEALEIAESAREGAAAEGRAPIRRAAKAL